MAAFLPTIPSSRRVTSDFVVGDIYEYNGAFKCPEKPSYNVSRNAGLPIDIPLNHNAMHPSVARDLDYMLTRPIAKPSRRHPMARNYHIQRFVTTYPGAHVRVTSDDLAAVENWFSPINGLQDNLAGLGGNWDHVKWNAMVVAARVKQMQLGPQLEKLIKVYAPIELYRIKNDSGETTGVKVMDKKEYEMVYGPLHVSDEIWRPEGGKTPATPTAPEIDDKEATNEDKDEDTVASETALETAPAVEPSPSTETSHAAVTEAGPARSGAEDTDTGSTSDPGDRKRKKKSVPEWRRKVPAPTGKRQVPHPLASIYNQSNFLPLDVEGKWVPPAERPERDYTSLIGELPETATEDDILLHGFLLESAQELNKEQEAGPVSESEEEEKEESTATRETGGEPTGLSRAAGSLTNIRANCTSHSGDNPRSGRRGNTNGASRLRDTVLKDIRASRSSRPSEAGKRKFEGNCDVVPHKKLASLRPITSECESLPKAAVPSLLSGLRGATEEKDEKVKKTVKWRFLGDLEIYMTDTADTGEDPSNVNSAKGSQNPPWQDPAMRAKFQAQYEERQKLPRFDRCGMPNLSKHLLYKRWHLIPVAYNIRGELRWWLLIIDMAVQVRDHAKEVPHRAVWVFNPCKPGHMSSKTPTTEESAERDFIHKIPEYLHGIANAELAKLDHHLTPVTYPRSSNLQATELLSHSQLSTENYDHPGDFRHFEYHYICGKRHVNKFRNPQSGVEVVHCLGRVLRIIELEDAGHYPFWQAINIDNIRTFKLADIDEKEKYEAVISDEKLIAFEQRIGNETDCFQNLTRTESFTEVRRLFENEAAKGYPFRKELLGPTPELPSAVYRILAHLAKGHKLTWKSIRDLFMKGAIGVLVGIRPGDTKQPILGQEATDKDSCKCGIIVQIMTRNTRVVLHGLKAVHPFDYPRPEDWKGKGAFDYRPNISEDWKKDNKRWAAGYNPYCEVGRDIQDKFIPKGMPEKTNNIFLNGFSESMISLTIDENGKAFIQASNRLNNNWRVNGIRVTQSEVIDRFSHITHLYCNGQWQWLWLRRYSPAKSAGSTLNESTRVKGDHVVPRSKKSQPPVTHFGTGTSQQPISSYSGARAKFYDMGRFTPHFHHHHRIDVDPPGSELAGSPTGSKQDYAISLMWQKVPGNILACTNPECMKWITDPEMKTQTPGRRYQVPCLNEDCGSKEPEHAQKRNFNCKDPSKNQCRVDETGKIGGHIPGVSGHMYQDTGVTVFHPEMLISNSQQTMSEKGIVNRRSGPAGTDMAQLPQPPMCFSRIVYSPIGRFGDINAAKEWLESEYNYQPALLYTTRDAGVVYDTTTYENLNYYRLLLWNCQTIESQRAWWAREREMDTEAGMCLISHWPEMSFRLGRRQEQDARSTARHPPLEEITSSNLENDTIEGTGERYAWNLFNSQQTGRSLSRGSHPWAAHARPALDKLYGTYDDYTEDNYAIWERQKEAKELEEVEEDEESIVPSRIPNQSHHPDIPMPPPGPKITSEELLGYLNRFENLVRKHAKNRKRLHGDEARRYREWAEALTPCMTMNQQLWLRTMEEYFVPEMGSEIIDGAIDTWDPESITRLQRELGSSFSRVQIAEEAGTRSELRTTRRDWRRFFHEGEISTDRSKGQSFNRKLHSGQSELRKAFLDRFFRRGAKTKKRSTIPPSSLSSQVDEIYEQTDSQVHQRILSVEPLLSRTVKDTSSSKDYDAAGQETVETEKATVGQKGIYKKPIGYPTLSKGRVSGPLFESPESSGEYFTIQGQVIKLGPNDRLYPYVTHTETPHGQLKEDGIRVESSTRGSYLISARQTLIDNKSKRKKVTYSEPTSMKDAIEAIQVKRERSLNVKSGRSKSQLDLIVEEVKQQENEIRSIVSEEDVEMEENVDQSPPKTSSVRHLSQSSHKIKRPVSIDSIDELNIIETIARPSRTNAEVDDFHVTSTADKSSKTQSRKPLDVHFETSVITKSFIPREHIQKPEEQKRSRSETSDDGLNWSPRKRHRAEEVDTERKIKRRKKKVDPDDLAYTDKTADKTALIEDAHLDRIPGVPPKKRRGRPPKALKEAQMREEMLGRMREEEAAKRELKNLEMPE